MELVLLSDFWKAEMEKGCPSVTVRALWEAMLSGCGVWSAGFSWQLLLNLLSCSLGNTAVLWRTREPHRLAVACRACLAAGPLLLLPSPPPFLSRTGVSLSSASWPHTLQRILLRSSHSWESAVTRDSKLRTQEWQRLGLLEIELEELCIKAFERNKRLQFQKWVYNEKWSRVHRWIF